MYIFFGVSVAASGVGFLASGEFGPYLLAALGGGGIYLLAFVFDLRAGYHRISRQATDNATSG